MELSKQEVELFLLFPDLQAKNLFYKKFLTCKNEFKTGFENRKWNYPNRKQNYFSYFLTSDQNTSNFLQQLQKLVQKTGWNYLNRKWKYFSYFLTSDQKTSFNKMFFTFNNDTKTCFENRNGIIQTRNVIISPRKPRKFWFPKFFCFLLINKAFSVISNQIYSPFHNLTFAQPYLERTFTWNSSVVQLSLSCFFF